VLEALGEASGSCSGPKNVRPTEVVEKDGGKIYLGSVELSYVGIVNT
jgi:hypothetical protein